VTFFQHQPQLPRNPLQVSDRDTLASLELLLQLAQHDIGLVPYQSPYLFRINRARSPTVSDALSSACPQLRGMTFAIQP
jgi:hypothetical protein